MVRRLWVKRGVAPRGVGDQLHDYYGAEKDAHPDVPIEMMVVANEIPRERRLYLDKWDIEPREITERTFREVAARVGYEFASEQELVEVQSDPGGIHSARARQNLASASSGAGLALGLLPALFATLEPSNLRAILARPETITAVGTDSPLRGAKQLQVRQVYFKSKGANEVIARAAVIQIYTEMPEPSKRIPGYERTPKKYYYDIRDPEHFRFPVQSLRYWRSQKNLRNDAQAFEVFAIRVHVLLNKPEGDSLRFGISSESDTRLGNEPIWSANTSAPREICGAVRQGTARTLANARLETAGI